MFNQLTCLYQFVLVIAVSAIWIFFETPSLPPFAWGSLSITLDVKLDVDNGQDTIYWRQVTKKFKGRTFNRKDSYIKE